MRQATPPDNPGSETTNSPSKQRDRPSRRSLEAAWEWESVFQRHNTLLNISGGTLIVQAGVGENTSVTGGDGIDSNGDITISGGTVIVFGSEGGADSALDYDGEASITGGTLAALGHRRDGAVG